MRSPFDLGAKQMKDISLRILDMECAACVARLDRALEKLPGVQRAAVNYTAASALITYDERVTDLAAIAARVKRAGFRVPVEEQDLLPAEADAETAAAAAAALRAVFGVKGVAVQADGTLSEADAATLRQMIARALEHPEVREWFGGGWERVRNENEIIIPGRGSTRRPDRVMIDGRRVVVVDYKFGLRDAERHRRQMREYLRLLGEMGYAPAEGYLWYVKLGKIEKVEP